jgi:FKBP-type peptidyl-prolyl cis-trans isomerase
MNYKEFILLFVLSLFMACRNENPRISEDEIRKTEEALVGANRMMVHNDKVKIQEYSISNKLNLVESESGLWYGIIRQGNGRQVTKNTLVSLEYAVQLMDGTACYSSDSLGIKQFIVGKGGVESGLEEGVLMLKEGSEAVFIMPPHLAHGLTGDGNKIPARSIIIYNVKLVNVDE